MGRNTTKMLCALSKGRQCVQEVNETCNRSILYHQVRNWIHKEKSHLAIHAPKFTVYHTIKDVPVCDAASRLAAAMVSQLRVHAAANVIKLFV
ncbi:hypothetical protein TNCV_1606381 [Trichonephila clavipes]|nr:hypothetical protein TNCV_1606381 [Trichonephila clavipes]